MPWKCFEVQRLAETRTPTLILLDMHMPRLDGVQTCAEFRKRPQTAHTPILMLTAVIEETSIEQAFLAGATDYMAKPLSPTALRFRVASLINAHRRSLQLQETKARLQLVIHCASDGILTLDESLRVIAANPMCAQLFATAVENLIGRSLGELLRIMPEQLGPSAGGNGELFSGRAGRSG
ncbi:MAG: response regulator [Acidobacteriota bacterium]